MLYIVDANKERNSLFSFTPTLWLSVGTLAHKLYNIVCMGLRVGGTLVVGTIILYYNL